MFKTNKKRLYLKQATILVLLLLLFLLTNRYNNESDQLQEASASFQIAEAFSNHHNNIQVQGSGTVVKILPDDRQGSKHQKFIVQVADELTVLISHNIDLAPRISSLNTGEDISFFGEYVWNPMGGIIHWTHHDPAKRSHSPPEFFSTEMVDKRSKSKNFYQVINDQPGASSRMHFSPTLRYFLKIMLVILNT